MEVYEAVVKGLESAGVETAFGGNGENVASLMLALKHSDKIRPIMTRHEQAASFMACGYAMFTDRLGVCFADRRSWSVQPVLRARGRDVRLVSGPGDHGLRGARVAGARSGQRHSGLNGTPDSQAMFAATTKKSYPPHRPQRHVATCSRRP